MTSSPSLETTIRNLLDKLEYINQNETFVTKFDSKILKDRLGAIKSGNMLYNKNNAFLRKKKEPVGIDLQLIKDDIDVVYDYALKYDIFAAPKSTTIEVKINTDKFFI
jgi:hypothetical protein